MNFFTETIQTYGSKNNYNISTSNNQAYCIKFHEIFLCTWNFINCKVVTTKIMNDKKNTFD